MEVPRLGVESQLQLQLMPQAQIQPSLVTYTTAHGHARFLTHSERPRPGIEPESLQILAGFVMLSQGGNCHTFLKVQVEAHRELI